MKNAKNAYEIIIAPVITERSMANAQNKKYTFKVADGSTKIDIARAVADAFELKQSDVVKVNTMKVRGRFRRQGKNEGYTASWKKAIVTLKPEAKSIEFFDGML